MRTWGELAKKKKSGTYQSAKQIVEQFGHDLDTPWRELSEECRNAILYGGAKIVWRWSSDRGQGQHEGLNEGVVNSIRRRYHQTKSDWTRRWYATFMSQQPCSTCHGQRLRPESGAVTIGGKTIIEATAMSIGEAVEWVEGLWPQMTPE